MTEERNFSTEALILRSRESPSGNRIITLLTPFRGLFDAFVFGGGKSALRAAASPFVYGTAYLYQDGTKNYTKLTDFSIAESFSSMRQQYESLWAASVMAEFVVRTQSCGGEHAAVLKTALSALRLMDQEPSPPPKLTLTAFLWQGVSLIGLKPDTERCVSCGLSLTERSQSGRILYEPSDDGFLCEHCAKATIESALSRASASQAMTARLDEPEYREHERISLSLEGLFWLNQVSERGFSALETASTSFVTDELASLVFYLAKKAAEGTLLSLIG